MSREIILHCFQWNLKDIINELQTIKNQGFTSIQITPINPCKEGMEYWVYYQPLDFAIGNRTGTKEDLIELCTKAKKLGIKIIVDVVLRHVAGTNDGKLIPHQDVAARIKNGLLFFTNAENTTEYQNRDRIINGAFGLPMLNYNNQYLQDIYISFLDELKDCGISGFRLDMGKHFALPEEGSNFFTNVFKPFKNMFNYAECLECSKELLDKYTKYIDVLTDYGLPSDKSKSVVYVESHDSNLSFHITDKMSDELIIKEWNYLLETNRESHVLFYVRQFNNTWKSEEIKQINMKH